MKAYSHSTAHYDRKGQCRYEYGPPRLVVERKPEPEPEAVKAPPAALGPLPFARTVDGLSIVFSVPPRKPVKVTIALASRVIDLDHPEAVALKTAPNRPGNHVVVRVLCNVCGYARHMKVCEWNYARGCKQCAVKHIKRELGAPLHKRPGDILPFATMGRRGR
jgi:hypothetical protein